MSSKTTYYCDRCGKEINGKQFPIRRFVGFEHPVFSLPHLTERIASKYDLCRECNDNHNKFMHGEKLVCERFDEILTEFNRDPDEQGNEGEMSESTN